MIGRYNPLAPPVRSRSIDGAVHGTANLDAAYEGPPGCVHGGVIASMFDELLGVANISAGVGAMTGTLTIKYRSPTPLQTDSPSPRRSKRRRPQGPPRARSTPATASAPKPTASSSRSSSHASCSTGRDHGARDPGRVAGRGAVTSRRVALRGPVNFRDLADI